MPRQPNAIDFWRGFALVSIFINHIGSNFYASFTHQKYSISDAAELFVFLAGWAVCLVAGKDPAKRPLRQLASRFIRRAVQIYGAQLFVAAVGIAALAGAAAWVTDYPEFLQRHKAEVVFEQPIRAAIGLIGLTYHLSYFSVLPLYVVLILLAPAIVAIDRLAPSYLLPLSLGLYVVTLVIAVPIPTWPDGREWFFHPLAWQFVFVLGFVLAKPDGVGGFVRRHILLLRLAAVPVLVAGLFLVTPSREQAPEPYLFFIDSKMFATPVRIVQFLALVAVFSLAFPYIRKVSSALTGLLSLLGRNSLLVFSMGSLLSLSGEIAAHATGGGLFVDTVTVVAGVAVMALAAWLGERQLEHGSRVPAVRRAFASFVSSRRPAPS